MLPEWITHLTAARGLESNDLRRPDELLLGRHLLGAGRRQLFLPLATFILAGLEPSSLVRHRAV